MPAKIDPIITPEVAKGKGNMKVEILETGNYLDPARLPQRKAKRYAEGEVVELPLDYAQGIVASGLARQISEGEVTSDAMVEIEWDEAAINATPGAAALAVELAEEKGIDVPTLLAGVVGSGAGGRIVMADVEKLE